jgi:hypothetical protein
MSRKGKTDTTGNRPRLKKKSASEPDGVKRNSVRKRTDGPGLGVICYDYDAMMAASESLPCPNILLVGDDHERYLDTCGFARRDGCGDIIRRQLVHIGHYIRHRQTHGCGIAIHSVFINPVLPGA